jgi:hypothetical protein
LSPPDPERRSTRGGRCDEALELPWPQAMRAVLVDERARLDAARDKLISVQY